MQPKIHCYEMFALSMQEAAFVIKRSKNQPGTDNEDFAPSIFNINDRDSSYDERENLQIIK